MEKPGADRRTALLETCFDVFCRHGLENTGLKLLADACGVTNGALLYHFGSKDNIVIESTAHCMAKVEDDFMAHAPRSFADIERFLREMPYITARLHGEKYRFMYQVYASPKYREQGKTFFQGVNVRYWQYALQLSGQLGMPTDYIQGMIYVFVRACVHYAMFGDEEYLNLQLGAVRSSLRAYMAAGRSSGGPAAPMQKEETP
ncbi:TetR/AcrR family transcriptional regulator [uncultured Subdoligranulum sp.]|uniref:TetR/AcrR family transcriptional regulator n=1 Tax=uncultured Subdoligranulum sp. TaxID=512298 RepID=UPI0025DA35CD|nr:TetR/AcrR family transcriptional regulator [uncultured Subdoligranulum sp.]